MALGSDEARVRMYARCRGEDDGVQKLGHGSLAYGVGNEA